MPRRRPGSPGTASGPGFRRDPGHETAPGINGHPRAGKVPDPARISRMAWVGAAPPTLWIVNQALASGVGFPDIRGVGGVAPTYGFRSEEHTSELQSLMRISYAVLCLKKKIYKYHTQ